MPFPPPQDPFRGPSSNETRRRQYEMLSGTGASYEGPLPSLSPTGAEHHAGHFPDQGEMDSAAQQFYERWTARIAAVQRAERWDRIDLKNQQLADRKLLAQQEASERSHVQNTVSQTNTQRLLHLYQLHSTEITEHSVRKQLMHEALEKHKSILRAFRSQTPRTVVEQSWPSRAQTVDALPRLGQDRYGGGGGVRTAPARTLDLDSQYYDMAIWNVIKRHRAVAATPTLWTEASDPLPFLKLGALADARRTEMRVSAPLSAVNAQHHHHYHHPQQAFPTAAVTQRAPLTALTRIGLASNSFRYSANPGPWKNVHTF